MVIRDVPAHPGRSAARWLLSLALVWACAWPAAAQSCGGAVPLGGADRAPAFDAGPRMNAPVAVPDSSGEQPPGSLAGTLANPAGAATPGSAGSVTAATPSGSTSGEDRIRPWGPVKRAGAELVHAVTYLGSDAAYVATSPLRLNRTGLMWTAGVVGIAALVYAQDDAIYDAAQRSRGSAVYDAAIKTGNNLESVGLMGRTWPYWCGLWVVGRVARIEVLQQIPAEVLESHFIAGGIRNGGKLVLGRRRPFEGFGPRKFELNGGTSFPSGHTSVAFEIATVLSHHAHWWPVTVVTYGLATTVAMQRVDSGNHWASDCVVPVVTGTLTAATVIRRNEERRSHAAATLVPVAIPGGVGLVLGARF